VTAGDVCLADVRDLHIKEGKRPCGVYGGVELLHFLKAEGHDILHVRFKHGCGRARLLHDIQGEGKNVIDRASGRGDNISVTHSRIGRVDAHTKLGTLAVSYLLKRL
jgi:hypothetical protein